MLLSKKVKKQHVFKWRSSNYYRVATLFKSYLTVKGIIMQRLKLIGKLTIRANRYVRIATKWQLSSPEKNCHNQNKNKNKYVNIQYFRDRCTLGGD